MIFFLWLLVVLRLDLTEKITGVGKHIFGGCSEESKYSQMMCTPSKDKKSVICPIADLQFSSDNKNQDIELESTNVPKAEKEKKVYGI